jgi:hypothetical protein
MVFGNGPGLLCPAFRSHQRLWLTRLKRIMQTSSLSGQRATISIRCCPGVVCPAANEDYFSMAVHLYLIISLSDAVLFAFDRQNN